MRPAWPWLTSGALLTVLSSIGLFAAGRLGERPASTTDFSSIYLLWFGLLVGLPMLAIGLRRAIDALTTRPVASSRLQSDAEPTSDPEPTGSSRPVR